MGHRPRGSLVDYLNLPLIFKAPAVAHMLSEDEIVQHD